MSKEWILINLTIPPFLYFLLIVEYNQVFMQQNIKKKTGNFSINLINEDFALVMYVLKWKVHWVKVFIGFMSLWVKEQYLHPDWCVSSELTCVKTELAIVLTARSMNTLGLLSVNTPVNMCYFRYKETM